MSDLTSEERLTEQLAEANTEIALLRGRLHTIGMAGEFGVTNGEVVARLRELESREDQCRQYIQHAQEREHHRNECEAHTNALVAAAYGACAKELNAELESIKDEDAEVRAIQRLLKVRTRIRSLTPADAVQELERMLAEARLEEAKDWMIIMEAVSQRTGVERCLQECHERIFDLTAAAKEKPCKSQA